MGALLEKGGVRKTTGNNMGEDLCDDLPLTFWNRFGHRTIDRLDLAPGSTVLNFGCGIAASVIPAAERVGPTGRVIGIDLAEQFLEQARAQAAVRGLGNLELTTGDMADLDLPDGRFDAVVCFFATCFAPDMAAQVRRLWRMIRPGGRLAITTWGPRAYEPAFTGWREAFRRVRPDLTTAFNPWLRFTNCRPWDRLTGPEEVKRLLPRGGIPNADIVAEEGRQPLRTPADWWTIALGSPLRWSIDRMSPEEAARVREANLKWLEDHGVNSVETSVIYAVTTKTVTRPFGQGPGRSRGVRRATAHHAGVSVPGRCAGGQAAMEDDPMPPQLALGSSREPGSVLASIPRDSGELRVSLVTVTGQQWIELEQRPTGDEGGSESGPCLVRPSEVEAIARVLREAARIGRGPRRGQAVGGRPCSPAGAGTEQPAWGMAWEFPRFEQGAGV